MSEENARLRELVAEVAAAYFSNTHISPADIPAVVNQIAASLQSVGEEAVAPAAAEEAPAVEKLTSAQIRRSVTPDGLISFEDNKSYKTLRRHLATRGMSPEQYRAKWGLPTDYPMVSPNYSAARSQMAKNLGLGRKPGATVSATSTSTAAPTEDGAPAAEKRGPGRPRKSPAPEGSAPKKRGRPKAS